MVNLFLFPRSFVYAFFSLSLSSKNDANQQSFFFSLSLSLSTELRDLCRIFEDVANGHETLSY